jgi:predicted RNA-binding Zn-ribbon protein involved in translation (DUF1610 family)
VSAPTPRAQPFHCPYCGEEDIRPGPGTIWHCRSCDRRFDLRFIGLGAPTDDASEEVET